MELKPTLGRAIIKPDAKDYENTSSGIVLRTDFVEPDTTTGVIIALSERTLRNNLLLPTDPDIQVGQHIVYKNRTVRKNDKEYNPLEFEVDGEKFISIEIVDIYGVYSE